jgi:enoyl-CoA hydratase
MTEAQPLGDSPSPHVRWRCVDRVWTITIDRPAARNALTSTMYGALKMSLRLASARSDVAVIVLRGVPGAFAVGGDLNAFLDLVEGGEEYFRQNFESVYEDPLPFHALLAATKPVVAAIDGPCVAGGLLIASCCDLTIASVRSIFGVPEARVGLADSIGAELLVPSIGLMRTRYLMMTGKLIGAQEAERWGMITRCVPQESFEEAVAEIVTELRAASPTSQRAYKELLNARIGRITPEVLMSVSMSPDGREGLRAFKEKRQPVWPSLGAI